MIIGVMREWAPGERRVAIVPESVSRLAKTGHRILVQAGAGENAYIPDSAYQEAGAEVVATARELVSRCDIICRVRAPQWDREGEVLDSIRPGTVLIGVLQPLVEPPAYFSAWAQRGVTTFSLDAMPRISRAQSMDVLSSMSTIAGYRAVVMAAERLGKFFPLLMTAAGTIPPAKVLVLGAGVAGLQAVATAHRLGAVVQAFDTRAVVREQVESLGASFLTLEVQAAQTRDGYAQALAEDVHAQELKLLAGPVAAADVVITTALIPGQRAPILVTRTMIEAMRPGSVIVDLAAEAGGNVEGGQAGETVVVNGVSIMAPLNVPSQLPLNASQLFSRNLTTFLQHLEKMGLRIEDEPRRCEIAMDDEIVRRTVITHNREIVHEAVLARGKEGQG